METIGNTKINEKYNEILNLIEEFKKENPKKAKELFNQLLLIEAKKRYPIGTRFKAISSDTGNSCSEYTQNTECYLYEDSSGLWVIGSANIYSSKFNKWAKILPSYPQITINSYTGEFFDNYVKFGCAEIDKELFIDCNKIVKINYSIHGTKNVESITIGKGTFSKEQIKEIAEYYLNKK